MTRRAGPRGSPPRSLAAALVLGLTAAAGPSDAGAITIEAYEEGRQTYAVAHFRAEAERGDARAMEVLAFMYLHGSTRHGAAAPVDREQALHSFQRAAQNGRLVSKHMVCVLTTRTKPGVAARPGCGSLRGRPS